MFPVSFVECLIVFKILAGDVSHDLDQIKTALLVLKSKFKYVYSFIILFPVFCRYVFFTPGNHDFWVTAKDPMNSVDKVFSFIFYSRIKNPFFFSYILRYVRLTGIVKKSE